MTSDSTTPALALEEFRQLRATIRERGHLRILVVVLTFVSWCALALTATPLTTWTFWLAPLVVLMGGYEAVFATHVGVERIGRYLATHYEAASGTLPAWERTATRLGSDRRAATGVDPLFTRVFVMAVLLNALPAAAAEWHAGPPGLATILAGLVVHAASLARLWHGARFCRDQRVRDADLFARAGL
jgi:hypothetical protein